jgi:hypothetical protein
MPIKFSKTTTKRHNGQPEGEVLILDADRGEMLGAIVVRYDDPTWARRADRSYHWRVARYEVTIFAIDRDDVDRDFEVEI